MSHRKAKVYGLGAPFINIGLGAPSVTQATRAPTTADHGTIGDIWINTATGIGYQLVQNVSGTFTWSITSAGSGDLDTLTGDAGGAITPAAGNITLAGGTNIATSGAGNTVTFNLDAAITLATSVTAPTYASAAAMAINPVGALTVTGGAAIDINVAAGSNITMQMGDAGGVNVIDFEDSASATVASLNSNGQFSAVNVDAIIGAVTPAAGTFTTLAGTTSVTSPIFTTGAGAVTNIRSAAGQNIVIRMGDAAGANIVSFTDSADVEVFSIDSNGGLPTIGGALTVTGLITGNGSATLNTAGAALNLGTDNAAGAVNLGTGTTIRAIGIGNVGGVAHTIAIGAAAAGVITVDTGASISLDSVTASNFTVTGAADLALGSTAGGVNITSGEAASATGITIDATAADGGVTIDAGSGGVNIATTVGAIVVGIGDIAPTAARTITVGGGTVVTAAVTDTIDIGPDGATTNADSVKTVNVNTGGVTTGQVLTNVATGTVTSGTHTTAIASGNRVAGTMALNVMTGTGTKTLNIGNTDAGTTINLDGILAINNNVNAAVTINDGTSTGAVTIGSGSAGIITIDSDANFSINADDASTISVTAGTLDLDSSGALSINSSAGVINIGNDAVAQAMNIGTGGAARTITLGNNVGATSVVVDCGTGALNIGSNGIARATTVGNTTGASSLILQAGTGEITMTGTVKEVTSEFTTRSGDFVTFTQSPILQSNANTGAAPTGATNDVNLMLCQEGMLMEQFILGAGQTIIAPRMTANGLNVALDLTAAEGAEYNFGAARTNSRHAFTIGTSAAFFFECRFRIADMSGADPYVFGFRRSEANNATFADYTDKASIGMRATTSATEIVLMTELNSAGETITNTTDVWGGDGTTNTLQVLVSAAGVVTYTINGLAPTITAAFTFDNGDVVVPFFRLNHAAVAPGAVEWVWMKIGFQA